MEISDRAQQKAVGRNPTVGSSLTRCRSHTIGETSPLNSLSNVLAADRRGEQGRSGPGRRRGDQVSQVGGGAHARQRPDQHPRLGGSGHNAFQSFSIESLTLGPPGWQTMSRCWLGRCEASSGMGLFHRFASPTRSRVVISVTTAMVIAATVGLPACGSRPPPLRPRRPQRSR